MAFSLQGNRFWIPSIKRTQWEGNSGVPIHRKKITTENPENWDIDALDGISNNRGQTFPILLESTEKKAKALNRDGQKAKLFLSDPSKRPVRASGARLPGRLGSSYSPFSVVKISLCCSMVKNFPLIDAEKFADSRRSGTKKAKLSSLWPQKRLSRPVGQEFQTRLEAFAPSSGWSPW